jgi:ABC-2 type transport system ATP-binding protein
VEETSEPISETIIDITGIRVTYGFRRAVDNLTFSIKKGESLAMLGVNGAGKTSTLDAMLGLKRPAKGKVSVFGKTPGSLSVLRRIGYAPEDSSPPGLLKASEYLGLVASLKIADRSLRKNAVLELMDWFDLPAKTKIETYSKGTRRRLILAQALLGKPDLIIFDEPLNGLDPLFILKLRDRIQQYVNLGGTVVFSSHILAEVEKTCSRVIILQEGKLLRDEHTDALVKQFGSIEKAFSQTVGLT